MSGLVFAMVGIFTWAFSGTAVVDPELIGILPTQGCINFHALTTYLNINGNAFFLPPQYTGEPRVMQFNPNTNQDGFEVLAGKKKTGESSLETGSAGLVTHPS